MSERLFEAIAAGDADQVRELLETRPELAEARNDEGRSAVLHALYTGQPGLVEPLLDANPALDVFDAAATGRIRGLEELLEADASAVSARSPDGFTALHYAAFFGAKDTAELLLDRGADANVVAENPELTVTPLHSAAAGAHAEIVELLLERGADPNIRQGGGFVPLHSAAQNGDRRSAEALLEHGADRTAQSDEGKTAAELAAGDDDLVELLS